MPLLSVFLLYEMALLMRRSRGRVSTGSFEEGITCMMLN